MQVDGAFGEESFMETRQEFLRGAHLGEYNKQAEPNAASQE